MGGFAACLAAYRALRPLLLSDDGVSTVEWVALAAAMVIGSVGVAYIVMTGLGEAANNVANQLK